MRNTLTNLLVSSVRQTSNGAIFPMLSRHRLHVECVLDPRKHSLLSLDFNYKPVFLYSQSFIGMKKNKSGECAARGIYFYTLVASKFTVAGKVILQE